MRARFQSASSSVIVPIMTPSTTKTWEGPYERDDLWNDDDPEIIQRDMAKEEPMQPSGRHHDATVPSLVQKQVTGPQRIPFLSPESGDFITGVSPRAYLCYYPLEYTELKRFCLVSLSVTNTSDNPKLAVRNLLMFLHP